MRPWSREAALSYAISSLAPVLVDKPGGDVLRALPVPNFQVGVTQPQQHPTIATTRLCVSFGHLPILVGFLAKSWVSEKAFQSNEPSFSMVRLSPFHHKPHRNISPHIPPFKWGQGGAFSFIPWQRTISGHFSGPGCSPPWGQPATLCRKLRIIWWFC